MERGNYVDVDVDAEGYARNSIRYRVFQDIVVPVNTSKF